MAPPSAAFSPGATSLRRCCSSGSPDRMLRRVPLRAALGAFVLGAFVYALDSALFFGSLERTSAPLASLVHYAHLVLVVGVAAMIGRERADAAAPRRARRDLRRCRARRRRGREPRPASGSGWRSARRQPTPSTSSSPTGSSATPTRWRWPRYLTAGAATSFFVAGAPARLARHGRRPDRARLPRSCAALVGSVFAVTLIPQGRPPRRPVDGLAARHGRGAGRRSRSPPSC